MPIKAYIRKLFFKSRLCSWSGFISCSNFRINILGKDILDLYGLVFKIELNLIIPKKTFCHFCVRKMSRILAIELVGPQKFEFTESIQEVWKVTHLDSAWLVKHLCRLRGFLAWLFLCQKGFDRTLIFRRLECVCCSI